MYRRDYLQRLIEEAGHVISRLMGLRTTGQHEDALRLIGEVYDSFFSVTHHEIQHTSPEALPDLMANTYQLSEEQISVMADLMREEAELWFEQGKWGKGQQLLRGALNLLRHLDQQQPDLYSFERARKIDTLEELIERGPKEG
jgi:hypothetical protein